MYSLDKYLGIIKNNHLKTCIKITHLNHMLFDTRDIFLSIYYKFARFRRITDDDNND
jgi:hypothetical protein